MSGSTQNTTQLLPEQEEVRARCVNSLENCSDFPKQDVEGSIPELFENIARACPDRLALTMGNRSLTYSDLNQAANRIARAILAKRGAGGEPIALLFEHGIDVIAAILGVLKSGKFYVAIDPSFPPARIEYILEDSKPYLIVTNSRNLALARRHGEGMVLSLGEIDDSLSCENLSTSPAARQLAAIMYTSGSTGTPKGVPETHAIRLRMTQNHSNLVRACSEDRLALLHSVSFSSANVQLFSAFLAGASLWPFDLKSEGIRRLAQWLQYNGITILHLPPIFFRELSETIDDPSQFNRIRMIRLSGAAVTQVDFELYAKKWPRQTSLAIHMGSTEAGTIAQAIIDRTFQFPDQGTPLGYPPPGQKVVLIDESGQEVRPGGAGELLVKGPYVKAGYWNRLTRDEATRRPVTSKDEYRTGDMARMLPDGFLIHLGRKDSIVKVRGYRVAISEIEKALLLHPQVSEAAVAAWEGDSGDKYLVGYIVMRDGARVTVDDLRGFLRGKLPDYMVPPAFAFLESLPMTNGKLDRQALPKPDNKRPVLSATYALPRNEIEKRLIQIWEEVLGVCLIGVNDNFLDLGGHSLAASRVVARVFQQFQLEIPQQALFESPTVAEMAAVITEQQERKLGREGRVIDDASASSPESVPRDARLFLSFAQQRLWFLNQLEPDSPVYNEPKTLRLRGRLDVESLHRALNAIVGRHEVLRTAYGSVNGRPIQVIHQSGTVQLMQIDLSGWPITRREKEAHRVLREQTHRVFNLSEEFMLRATLIRLGEEDHILLLVTHHIASDGWSSGILFRELSALYEAFSHGRPSPLKDLLIQYADYALWQRGRLQGKVLEQQLSYWKKQLEGLAPLQLPTDTPRSTVQGYRGKTETFALPKELAKGLKDLSHEQHVTLFMTLLAAFQILLHRYTDRDDIAVGTPTAGRTRMEIERLIGFFVNTLVLRSNFDGDPTFLQLLTRVREMALGAYAHHELPFEKLVEELQPERSLSHNPLFQVMFQLRNYPTESVRLPALTIEEFQFDTGVAKFDLSMGLRDETSGLNGSLEYRTDLFYRSTIMSMIEHFQVLLEGIVADPERRVSELPMLTRAERHRLLVEWNDTKKEYDCDKYVHQLFEEQVERTPDAVALVLPSTGREEGQQLTYTELNRRANQLAHYLRNLGVGPEVLVGISLERSLEMVVSVLGVLKAGGAYCPLDPGYPKERLAFMLQDAQVSVLLTRQCLMENFPPCQARVVCLDAEWQLIAQASDKNPVGKTDPENLAYVIYTSGSTGQPKGVLVLHRGVVNHTRHAMAHYAIGPTDRHTQFASLGFDVAAAEIFSTLASGAALILKPDPWFESYRDFSRFLEKEKLTIVSLPTAYWHGWVSELSRFKTPLPSGLRLVIIGTEQASAEHFKRWQNVSGGKVEWCNAYGPTEATITSTVYGPLSRQDHGAQTVAIGRPIANTEIYLLDRYLQPAPVGVLGELHIGGIGLSRGYLARPDITAEKFIPHPFGKAPGSRLYKTGDLARYLPDGNIEFAGRSDDQVKIRGFRIEPGEIEAALRRHPAVQQTAVVAREDVRGEKRLVAYVVCNDELKLTITELRSFLKEHLPDYMIPSALIALPALPVTHSGKVDRRALPAPDSARPELESHYVPPRTPVEKLTAKIWSKVLRTDKIGIRDNFFDLGGHSLLATQVISRIQDAFQLSLPLRILFERPTIEELAVTITDMQAKRADTRDMRRMLAELESISDEEAQRLISEQQK